MTTRGESTIVNAEHPAGAHASVIVAVVIFSIRADATGRPRLQVLLVRRAVEPFAGYWSLPGGRLWGDEALDHAAWRQLLEKTALRASYLEQLYTFELCAGSQIEAAVVASGRKMMEAAWFPVDEPPAALAAPS